MNDDSMRRNHIQVYKCFECGNKLNLTYDFKDGVELGDSWESGDPTGATCLYQTIMIHPCKNCIDKHTAPAKQLAQAINQLTKKVESDNE